MRLLIFGSRDWTNKAAIEREIDARLPQIDVVICGMCRGADLMGREYALSRGIPVEEYPANWGRFGKGAGHIRNQQMIDEGKPTEAVGFHEDITKSKGTKDMAGRLVKHNIPVQICKD